MKRVQEQEAILAERIGRGSFDFEKAIGRYSVQMMTSVLADFLQLGHEARGTQSLAIRIESARLCGL